jgi:hypothetical protein
MNERRIARYGAAGRVDLVHFTLADIGVEGELAATRVSLRSDVVLPFVRLVNAWQKADVWRHVQTFDRSYDAKEIRPGRRGAHGWGNAFDVNTQWNPLGSDGAERGQIGSTHELEDIAGAVGWTCGRTYFALPGRAGRHFEYFREAE